MPLDKAGMYSIMLYMKTRVTFRLPEDLAEELKELPNQTHFVEVALRDALGVRCPWCAGSGRVSRAKLTVSNFRRHTLPPLNRRAALELKQLIQIARQLRASRLELSLGRAGRFVADPLPPTSLPLGYVLTRGDEVLLTGILGYFDARKTTTRQAIP